RDEVAALESSAAAELRERMARQIVLLGDQRQRPEVVDAAHAADIDALLGQERAIGRHARRHVVEQRQRAGRRVLLPVRAVEQTAGGRRQEGAQRLAGPRSLLMVDGHGRRPRRGGGWNWSWHRSCHRTAPPPLWFLADTGEWRPDAKRSPSLHAVVRVE